MVDPAVNVALLGFHDGALEPGPSGGELTGATQKSMLVPSPPITASTGD